jgi:hypothetical protein
MRGMTRNAGPCSKLRDTCYNIGTIKKNTQTLIDASKQVGLEVNTEKTKYMLLSHHQNAGKIHDIKIANRCFENVAQFRYLGLSIRKSKPDLGGN